jgi:KUP system potassium uptake protein
MTTATEGAPSSQAAHGHATGSKWALMVGAVGVVYGDIGTSPLYAMKECFSPESLHHVQPTAANVLGVLSLMFWALTVIVTIKYLVFVLRADNEGAGGMLALFAVMGTMLITTTIFSVVVRQRWGWPIWEIAPLTAIFLVFDLGFLSSTVAKLADGIGGWAPLLMGTVVFTVMTTWRTGRAALSRFIKDAALPVELFLADVKTSDIHRVKGTAVFMASNPDATPPVLLHHVKHNQVLHRQVVLLSVQSERVPEVPAERRVEVIDRGQGIFQVIARYGFMQTPNVPSVMEACRKSGVHDELNSTSHYLGRETLLTNGKAKMARWRKALFAFVSRNARPATAYFGLPPNRVVELGMQVDL